MNKKNISIKGFYVLVLCLIVAGIFVFGINSVEKTAPIEPVSSQQNEVKIFNKTSGLEVVKNEIVGDELHLSLKNSANKGINAFQVLVGPEKGNSFGTFVEFTYSDIKDEISPNEIFVHRETLGKELYKDGVTLQAVFFTDGTSDGETDVIREANEKRRGIRFQLSAGLQLIRDALASPQNEFSAQVTALRMKISDLPPSDKTKPREFNHGLRSGKEFLLLDIKNIQNNKEELIKVEAKLKRIISRFSQIPDSETQTPDDEKRGRS